MTRTSLERIIAIFRVQMPLESNSPVPYALAYNQDRSVRITLAVTKELTTAMQGFPKQFFYCTYNPKSNELQLNKVAPWQEW